MTGWGTPPEVAWIEWIHGAAIADAPTIPPHAEAGPCRHSWCARPVVACGCPQPLLGWTHHGEPHRIGAHFCGVINRQQGEPEPAPETTLYRVLSVLPLLARTDAERGDRAAIARVLAAAEWGSPRWCSICLCAARASIIVHAAELEVDGPRILHLCAPHFADVRSHFPMFDDAQIVAAWEKIHRPREEAG